MTYKEENLKHKKKIAVIEVLTKEYFDECITELGESLKNGFARLRSDIFDMNTKIKLLDDSTRKNDLKTTFNTVESDSSVEILNVTPAKENLHNTRKWDTIDTKTKSNGLLFDVGERMRKKKKVVNQYDAFAAVNQNKADWLDAWMKIERNVTVNLCTIKADKQFFHEVIEPQIWLSEDHIDVGMSLLRRKLTKTPCPFHSERVTFLDTPFTVLVSNSYQKFLENPTNFDWSYKFTEYYNGVLPKCERTNKKFGVDVDDVYVVLNIKDVHWISLAILIPHRRINVYDSIISIANDEEIEEFVKPYALMVPSLIKSMGSPSEKNHLNADGYKITRCGGIPQNKISGDCGVYALKYIECLALEADMETGLYDANIKNLRKKLATDMFVEANHCEDL